MARSKGQRGEREIVALLQAVVNEVYTAYNRKVISTTESELVQYRTLEVPLLQRNTIQSDRGGYDIVGLDWLAPEVKRCETYQLSTWWQQCRAQAKPHQTPVLFYRRNNVPWRVRMIGKLPIAQGRAVRVVVDIAIGAFMLYLRERLVDELKKGVANGIR